MSTRSCIVSAVTFSFACGFSPMGVTYAESGARSSQTNDVTTAETKAAVAKEKAEAARVQLLDRPCPLMRADASMRERDIPPCFS